MSLVRQDVRFRFERLDGVYFLMADGGTHILCKVSHEAAIAMRATAWRRACPTLSCATARGSRRSPAKNTRKATGPTALFSC